jgi:AraC family transcriptional activator of pobA
MYTISKTYTSLLLNRMDKDIPFLKRPSHTPVIRNYFENWTIRAYSLSFTGNNNYLSPNRRDFYKILLLKSAKGSYTIGNRIYSITKPTIFFISPSEIISWKSDVDHFSASFCLFKKSFAEEYPGLSYVMQKHQVFNDAQKSAVTLNNSQMKKINACFMELQAAESQQAMLVQDIMQSYLQLILLLSVQSAKFTAPAQISTVNNHINRFFNLMETEMSKMNYDTPLRIKTAKEFADDLSITPNHLNALLKKQTGHNISTHIKNRIIDESKALLLQTDWTISDISYVTGFSDQPNFSAFFKKSTGYTPADFRKKYHS